MGITPKELVQQQFLETYITSNVEQLSEGSYRARFPWKDNHPPLPMNFSTCTRSLASKLALNPSLLTKYSEI